MSDKVLEANTKEEVKSKKGRIIFVIILTLVLAIGAAVAYHFVQQNLSYLTTDNATVNTQRFSVSSVTPGVLERFTILEGQHVSENEILGWVENGEAMRSPVDGVVILTYATQGQIVSPMEPLAIIADINRFHIEANIEETDIMRIQLGQNVTVTIDGFGDREFDGYISSIGRITRAAETGSTLFFNTGGTFTRVVHLIPIEISLACDVDLTGLIGVNARVRIPIQP
jgi:multidrug resistance efflux pump